MDLQHFTAMNSHICAYLKKIHYVNSYICIRYYLRLKNVLVFIIVTAVYATIKLYMYVHNLVSCPFVHNDDTYKSDKAVFVFITVF